MNRLRATNPATVVIRALIAALQVFALLVTTTLMPVGHATANGPIDGAYICSASGHPTPTPGDEGPRYRHDCVCSVSGGCGSTVGPGANDLGVVCFAPPHIGFVVYDALVERPRPILEIHRAPRGPPAVS